MFEIATNRVAGGLRLLRKLIDMGDVSALRMVLERNVVELESLATEEERLALAALRNSIEKMIEKENNCGVGSCLNLSHASVISAYQRPVPRIVAIVDARGGLISKEA